MARSVKAAEAASRKLAALLGGDGEHAGGPGKLPAPKAVKQEAVQATAPARSTVRTTPRKAAVPVTLTAVLEKRLHEITDAQRRAIAKTLAFDPKAKFGKPDADGDVLCSYKSGVALFHSDGAVSVAEAGRPEAVAKLKAAA